MLPQVQFIIPSYEGELTIRTCLESILNQDYPSELIQIHIIENGPKTNIETIVREYPNCFYYYNPIAGRSEARNFVLDKIHSEFVAFIDVDVVLSKTWLRECLKSMKSPYCAAVTGPVFRQGDRWIDTIRRKMSELSTNGQSNTMENPSTLGCMNTAAVLMRTGPLKFAGNFDTSFIRSEDLELTHRLLRCGFTIATSADAKAEVYWDRGSLEYFFTRNIEFGFFTAKAMILHQAKDIPLMKIKIHPHPFWLLMKSFFYLGFIYGKWKFRKLENWTPKINSKRIYISSEKSPLSAFEINPHWEIVIIRNSIRLNNRQLGKFFVLHPTMERIILELLEMTYYHASGVHEEELIKQLVRDQILLKCQ